MRQYKLCIQIIIIIIIIIKEKKRIKIEKGGKDGTDGERQRGR